MVSKNYTASHWVSVRGRAFLIAFIRTQLMIHETWKWQIKIKPEYIDGVWAK